MKIRYFTVFLYLIAVVGGLHAQTGEGAWVLAITSQVSSFRTQYPVNDQAGSIPGISYRIDRSTQKSNNINITSKTTTWSYNASPEVSYFVMNRLAVGMRFSIFRSASRGDEFSRNHHFRYNELSVGPMINYYLPVGKKNLATVGGGYHYGQLWTRYTADDEPVASKYSTWMQGLTAGAGVLHFIHPGVSIGAHLAYQFRYRLVEHSEADNFKSYVTSSSYGLSVSMQIWLAGRKERTKTTE